MNDTPTGKKVYVPPIKCQGIKTKIVHSIKEQIIWDRGGKWIEPFLGSGVVLFNIVPEKALVGDTNPHIIDFYNKIKTGEITSDIIRQSLTEEGKKLKENGEKYYYSVRERFNANGNPLDFLFLNRSCFNGVMRFNGGGRFNVPFGHKPDRFRAAYITKIVNQTKYVESVISPDWKFLTSDWRKLLDKATPEDFVYMDPPYIGRHTDYFNKWTEQDAQELVEIVKTLPCPFIFSMWSKNAYRTNPHLKLWEGFKMVPISHFYHVGATENLRNKMEEVLIIGFPKS